jgi:hypothetical protein
MDRHNIAAQAQGLVYSVVLLLLVLLMLAAMYCFLLLLVQPTEPWLRTASAVVGSVLIGLNVLAILQLNKFVAIKVVWGRYGVLLFWLGWAMPLLSLVLAIGSAVAAMCGVAFEVQSLSPHRWDWD